MKEKIKKYCENQLRDVKRWGFDLQGAITRSYGAVMFVCSQFPEMDEEIGSWWDNEMHPRFRELEIRGIHHED